MRILINRGLYGSMDRRGTRSWRWYGMMFLLQLMLSTAWPGSRLWAQKAAPFADEIAAFKKQDEADPVKPGNILLVGSSSFRFWKDVGAAFPGYPIINRGFGGSTLPDMIRYANDIIFPYRPKQIVIYCGDNDLAESDTVTGQVVFRRFQDLYNMIRARMKEVDILYVSIKPSPSRESMMPRMETANRLIGDYLRGKPHAVFVDIYHLMLTPEGRPKEELFNADRLHMNAKGYAIWRKAIAPHLDK